MAAGRAVTLKAMARASVAGAAGPPIRCAPMLTIRILQAGVALGIVASALAAPAAAAASPMPHRPPRPAAAIGVHGDTSDFSFDSFDGRYELGRTPDRRSTLRVTETLVAEFPSFDQNHGIVRDIPSTYDGHPVHLRIVSITDGAGTKRAYDESSVQVDGGSFLELKIGDPGGIDRYVHGRQTFRIVYTADDVTRHFANTHDDEFYWDVNGTGWEQTFGTVSATVVLGDGLASRLTGKASCYQGAAGSDTPCTITGDGSSGLHAAAQHLGPRENMTIAIGFASGTFAAAPFSIFDYVPLLAFLAVIGVLGSLVLAIVFRFIIWRPRSGDPIIAQYSPPDGVSAMLAANIVRRTPRGMAASIVDLAVRKKLRIIDRRRQGWLRSEVYGVQQLDDRGLLPDEKLVVDALFGSGGTVLPPGIRPAEPTPAEPTPPGGPVRWLQKGDTALGRAVRQILKQVDAEALATGLRRGRPHGILLLTALLGLGGLACFLVLMVSGGDSGAASAWGVGGIWVGVVVESFALSAVASIKPLTLAGSKVWDHLEGLKLYIRLAEADRLRMLQSVTGAERVDTTDGSQIVKVYERLLPYAVLFGLENEWAAQLATYYGDTAPDWYDGNLGTFSAIAFASAIGSFTTSAASSLSGSASSSSSGGSGGGGFSGGGGGGGGGGGF